MENPCVIHRIIKTVEEILKVNFEEIYKNNITKEMVKHFREVIENLKGDETWKISS